MKFKQKFISTLLALSMMLVFVQTSFAATLTGETITCGYRTIGLTAYSRMLNISEKGHIVVADSSSKRGLIDIDGNEILPYSYYYLRYLAGDYYRFVNNSGMYEYIRSDGTTVDFGEVKDVINYYGYLRGKVYDTNEDGTQSYKWTYRYLDLDLNEVDEETIKATINSSYTEPIISFTEEDDFIENQLHFIFDELGGLLVGPSSESFLTGSYWNNIRWSFTRSLSYGKYIEQDDYYGTVYPFHQTTDETKSTVFVDISTGEVLATMDGFVSNINDDGYYVYENESGTMCIGRTDQAYWVNGGEPIDMREYVKLKDATLYTSYLTTIPNMSESATLVSGALPKGLGIYPDGTIGGIPTQEGTFQFVVNTSSGEEGYSITVQENTSANVEADNDYEIIERIPDVSSNDQDYIYEVSGEYSQFLNVYLNGTLLIPEVEYLAEEGSTKITVLANTMAQLNTGSHTINATFTPVSVTPTSTSANVTVEKVAQTFEKTVEKTTEPAMPFTDVAESDWFYDYVLFVYKQGTFGGTSATTYSPSTSMNRGMMATVLYALADKPETESANLTDVESGIWYDDAVNWVVSRGIDDSTGTFRPEEAITREETAKMLYNFCTDQGIWLPLVTSSAANDMDLVSEDAKTHVDALYQRGIFSGDDNGNFNPQGTSNRDAIAVIVKNFMSVVM